MLCVSYLIFNLYHWQRIKHLLLLFPTEFYNIHHEQILVNYYPPFFLERTELTFHVSCLVLFYSPLLCRGSTIIDSYHLNPIKSSRNDINGSKNSQLLHPSFIVQRNHYKNSETITKCYKNRETIARKEQFRRSSRGIKKPIKNCRRWKGMKLVTKAGKRERSSVTANKSAWLNKVNLPRRCSPAKLYPRCRLHEPRAGTFSISQLLCKRLPGHPEECEPSV